MVTSRLSLAFKGKERRFRLSYFQSLSQSYIILPVPRE